MMKVYKYPAYDKAAKLIFGKDYRDLDRHSQLKVKETLGKIGKIDALDQGAKWGYFKREQQYGWKIRK